MGSLLLLGVAFLLAGGSGSSSHFMRYFYTAVSEPNQGLPQFITVGYVDDQLITHYDSNTQREVPKVPWMRKVEEYEPGYWDRQSQIVQANEQVFRVNLAILRDRYKQSNSTGLHVVQLMYGCEADLEGRPRGGHNQHAYDGEDFLAFDKETLSWTAPVPQAQITKERWDKDVIFNQREKAYLEEICVDWLRRYLDYGRETLRRTERPTVKVARRAGRGGQETLTCRAQGFYPKEIEISWTKDGEDRSQDTLTGGIVPNADGTYSKWLSIEVDPQDKGRYRCQVAHDSLPEPLDLAWEEPASNLGLLLGILGGVLAALILGAGVALYIKKRRHPKGGYKATAGSDQGSDCSTKVPMPVACEEKIYCRVSGN